jgi:uncharacterized protein (TIGR00369 family)
MSLLALPGVEQIGSFVDGRSPHPPVARLTGRRVVEVEAGRVVYVMPVSDWVVGPKGTLHPGVIAFLADAPLLAAVQSTLPPGSLCTTAEVSTTFLATARSGDELRAEAQVIHADAATGLAEAYITRRDGRVVGHATSRVFVFPPVPLGDDAPEPVFAEPDEHATPDPWERPALGGALTPQAFARLSGRELLEQQLAGALPRAPIDLLTGIRLVAVDEGTATFVLPTHDWCANELGTVFGGLIALLAASAGSAAVQTLAPAGTAFKALDLKLNLIRSSAPESGELTATGTVVHRGRQLAIANAEILNEQGKRVALSTGTTMLGPAAERESADEPAGTAFEAV